MPVARRQQQRVQDLELKLEISRKLLGCMTDPELVEKVLPSKKYGDLTSKTIENIRSWRRGHYPKKAESMKFWDQLAFELICPEEVKGARLVDVTIDRFIGYLPAESQSLAREILADFLPPDIPVGGLTEHHEPSRPVRSIDFGDANLIYVRHAGPPETVAVGVRAGKVDQKHYYLEPDSANAWSRLVNADEYPTYDHCRTGLQALFESEVWKLALDKSRPLTAVMLAGGGAPTKDLALLKSLLAQPYVQPPISYYLNDVSPYMLTASAVWIREGLRTRRDLDKVAVALVYGDVFELAGLKELFHKQGKALFAITGGTIGNLSESAFFHSLNRVTDDGDLLIVSADTLDGLPQDDIEGTLIGKYDNPELRTFIRPVVKAVLSEVNSQETLRSALDRIKVKVRAGSYVKSSDVPHSRSVIVTLDINRQDIVLVTSTRYQSAHLSTFAAGFGWQPVGQIPSPRNPHFQQFLFCRNQGERKARRNVSKTITFREFPVHSLFISAHRL